MKPMRYFMNVLAWFLLVGVAMPALCAEQVSASDQKVIPSDIRKLLSPGDTLLAYKTFDIFGDGVLGAVVIVRRTEKVSSDFDHNPCDLIILQRKNNSLFQMEKSSRVVDCTYSDIAKNAGALSLSNNLKLHPMIITYVNQQDKTNTQYTFSYSKEKQAWYVSQLVAVYPQNNEKTGLVDVVKEDIRWPKDFSWTPLSEFDPNKFLDTLEKHKAFIH